MFPTVRPATFTLVVPHATDVSEPQAPEKTWIIAPEEFRLDPIELSVTVALAAVAENEYQTSSPGFPVAQPTGMPLLADASHTEPELFVVPIVSAVAVAQSSFEGGGT